MADDKKQSYWDILLNGNDVKLSGVVTSTDGSSTDGFTYNYFPFVPNSGNYQPYTWTYVWPDPQIDDLRQQVEKLSAENTKLKNSNARLRRLLKRTNKRKSE